MNSRFSLFQGFQICALSVSFLSGCSKASHNSPRQTERSSNTSGILASVGQTNSSAWPHDSNNQPRSNSVTASQSGLGVGQAEAEVIAAVLRNSTQLEKISDFYGAIFIQSVNPNTAEQLKKIVPQRLPRIESQLDNWDKTTCNDRLTGKSSILVRTIIESSNSHNIVFTAITTTGTRAGAIYKIQLERVGDAWKVARFELEWVF